MSLSTVCEYSNDPVVSRGERVLATKFVKTTKNRNCVRAASVRVLNFCNSNRIKCVWIRGLQRERERDLRCDCRFRSIQLDYRIAQ
jgi:hypothetical protein